jgi:SWI/SNF-related matrix-associated actin-dependent regulator 1 of chromatin subfamily A
MKLVDYENGQLYISFSNLNTEAFYAALSIVKSLTGRAYKNKIWTAPAIDKNIQILDIAGFIFSKEARKLFRKKDIQLKRELPDINTKALKNFYPFQVEGVQFLEGRGGNGIIGDEMGLGKTIQSLGYLLLHPESRPCVIVCPASLKLNWEKEINKWVPLSSVEILQGKTPYTPYFGIDFYIINYDILGIGEEIEYIKDGKKKKKKILKGGWYKELLNIDIKLIIADEIQYISNHNTIRTKAFIQLCKKISHKIFLSGTPIKNRPSEFFTALNLIDPKTFTHRWGYLQTYCDPKHNGYGWTFNGLTNWEDLYRKIFLLMIRRKKKEVLKDLPDKTNTVIPLEVDQNQFKKYQELYNEIFSNEDDVTKLQKKNNYEKLKQLAYICKRDFVLKWIEDFISTGEKLVVFSYHRAVMDDIEKRFQKISVRIDGSVPSYLRQKIVDDFQTNPDILLFNGQIQAAGIGNTLTVSSSVAFIELGWTPSDHNQAGDRCHRIGQKDSVNIYYLIANGTVENKIVDLLIDKGKMIGKVLDGKEGEFFSGDILDCLR